MTQIPSKTISFLCCLFLCLSLPAQKEDSTTDVSKIDGEDFIELVRKSMINTCWIKMNGTINSRPKEGKRSRTPLSIAAEMKPSMIIFKSTLNYKESVKIKQTYGKIHDSKILEDSRQKTNTYNKLGIRPSDLSLSFIYWDMIKESEKEALGITRIKCRVFTMANPDANEYAKVWISEKYLGPIRVEWYGKNLTSTPKQILTFEAFSEKNKVWVPTEILINNPLGDLQIKLKDINAAFSNTSPADLYSTPKEKK